MAEIVAAVASVRIPVIGIGDGRYYIVEAEVAIGTAPAIDSKLGVQNQISAPNGTGPIAAGSLVAIYGTNFALAASAAASIPLPITLAGVSVLFKGIPTPIGGIAHSVTIGGQSYDQINAIVPWEVNSGTVPVEVIRNGNPSSSANVNIAGASPGIFYIATDSTE